MSRYYVNEHDGSVPMHSNLLKPTRMMSAGIENLVLFPVIGVIGVPALMAFFVAPLVSIGWLVGTIPTVPYWFYRKNRKNPYYFRINILSKSQQIRYFRQATPLGRAVPSIKNWPKR